MALFVQKFGGTSVGTVGRIREVAKRVAASVAGGDQVVVVVSAMSGETNRLEKLGFHVAPRPTPREMDVLLAAGEQVSVALVAMALIDLGRPARSWLGTQVAIRTDATHMKARIAGIDVAGLRGDLDAGITPVVAGFQGVNEAGDITTFGRGASDTTAIALAAAIGAAECQIYTDVDGVYTADPRIVPDARRLDAICVDEMLELASLGSKVLHARSLEFVGRYGVPMRVLSSFQDVGAGTGTLIKKEESAMEDILVSGLAHQRDEAKLTVIGIPDVPGMASRILGPIGAASIEVDMIVQNTSADGLADLTFTVSRADYERAKEILTDIRGAVGARRIEGDDRIAKVSAVGLGMRSHAGVATRMFDALAAENINIQMISTSEIKISVVVEERCLDQAVRAIHAAFGLQGTSAIDDS